MKKTVSFAIFTNAGGREVNEDSAGAVSTDYGNCYVLCDGLGGMGMGDLASQTVVQAITDYMLKNAGNPKFIGEAFEAAQQILLMEQVRNNAKSKMKTTATFLLTGKRKSFIAHVGDSRVYIFKKGRVFKRTLDHSIPQMLAMSGEISESEIRTHKDRNIVLRVMGEEWDEPKYDLMKPLPTAKCDAFLMCSDGFWELIEEQDMEACLAQANDANEWVNMMATIVQRNGVGKNMDNFTAIAVLNR